MGGGEVEEVYEEVEEQGQAIVEEIKKIPPWTKQITMRGLIASILIGIIYTVILMKLNLTTGLSPNLNVSAALLASVFLRTWTRLLKKLGIKTTLFTRQDTTVQTCDIACYSIDVGGGFGSYLLGLNKKTYELAGVGTVGNGPNSYKDLKLGWMTGFLFVSSFVGLWALVPLRKIMIIEYKLAYPSGTATAVLINGFHTAKGNKNAKKQVNGFVKIFSLSFVWSFFQWFYSGESTCGFGQFPTFGLKAWNNSLRNNISRRRYDLVEEFGIMLGTCNFRSLWVFLGIMFHKQFYVVAYKCCFFRCIFCNGIIATFLLRHMMNVATFLAIKLTVYITMDYATN